MSADPAAFGRRVRRAREGRGWSMRDLTSRCASLNPLTLMRAERGGDLTLSTAIQITKALGLSLDALTADPACPHCLDVPPAGFTCNECGAKGDQP